ncbi:hypothetical protein QUF58_11310 [Anaerolineales bacterium HSG24]|nr:hypothetical protein [Anaerolineales bacterium HSG24]
MSKFSEWTLIKLDKRFGIRQIRRSEQLTSWLESPAEIGELEQASLTRLKQILTHNVDNWNEQELSIHFIGPLLTLIDLSDEQDERFNIFAGRNLSGIVDGEEMSGNPDGMIASGWREPEIPYFCLQEYKREKDPNGDPAGQCLAAMLVAQTLNNHEHPIYGCYILGRNWFFILLHGTEYVISNAYCATRNDIFDIFRILITLKQQIKQFAYNDN